ncbi:glycosyltransferase family 2 protein [Nonlabens sp.]|uniref:glycosyltransferase family 2 protein n=1 Tax=Nonlabens sp. TaxID=1888209 RepID=UPI003266DA35
MKDNLISIIIPSYNRAHLIIETLESIRKQTYGNWECIIVDDRSTDYTEQVVCDYIKDKPRFSYYNRPLEKLKGANSCRNYGLSISNGDYIIFFDSDDVLTSTSFENRVKEFQKNDNLDIVIFEMGKFSGNKFQKESKSLVINGDWDVALNAFLTLKTLPWSICRPTYKKSFIDNIKFNENLQRFQDIDFNIRLLVLNKPIYISIPEIDCYYRIADNNNPRKPEFFTHVIQSVAIFIESITTCLNDSRIDLPKQKIKEWIFDIIRNYMNSNVSISILHKTISKANNLLNFNKGELFLIYSLGYLNKAYKYKKGYHFLYQKIKINYFKIIIK